MKIQRKYMAHYLNAAFSDPEASYVRLGNDLEEYAPELSANVEKKANILGQTTVVIDSYQKQGRYRPTMPRKGTRCLKSCRPFWTATWCWTTSRPIWWRSSSGATRTAPTRR